MFSYPHSFFTKGERRFSVARVSGKALDFFIFLTKEKEDKRKKRRRVYEMKKNKMKRNPMEG